jgi:hypothetical protein
MLERLALLQHDRIYGREKIFQASGSLARQVTKGFLIRKGGMRLAKSQFSMWKMSTL